MNLILGLPGASHPDDRVPSERKTLILRMLSLFNALLKLKLLLQN